MTVTEHESAAAPVADRLEEHRTELTGYCYRMLGSAFEAEDAVQDHALPAWRGYDGFEGRSRCAPGCTGSPPTSASTCCGEAAAGPPDGLRSGVAHTRLPSIGSARATWIEPIPTRGGVPSTMTRPRPPSPASGSASPSSPPCSTFRPGSGPAHPARGAAWKASEVAEVLDTTVASVNRPSSGRVRRSLPRAGADADGRPARRRPADLLDRYVAAFEATTSTGCSTLLHEDADPVDATGPTVAPRRGRHHRLAARYRGRVPQLPAGAHRCQRFACFRDKPDPAGGFGPWALVVLGIDQGRIAELA